MPARLTRFQRPSSTAPPLPWSVVQDLFHRLGWAAQPRALLAQQLRQRGAVRWRLQVLDDGGLDARLTDEGQHVARGAAGRVVPDRDGALAHAAMRAASAANGGTLDSSSVATAHSTSTPPPHR